MWELLDFKRRKISSHAKILHGYYDLTEPETNKKITFNLYTDRNLGFKKKKWQRKLKIAKMDDDVMTDDEQLKLAYDHCMRHLQIGIDMFNQDAEKNLSNKIYFD
jgi:hypothetical protein